jgi:hypothetical protein
VGVFFVTQTPRDVPQEVLAQLGHRGPARAPRVHADDEKALKATANTFPTSPFYDIPKTLTSLGIGEALVTALPAGTPTPVAATLLPPPMSLMGPIPPDALDARVRRSRLFRNTRRPWIGRARASSSPRGADAPPEVAAAAGGRGSRPAPAPPTVADEIGKALGSPTGRTITRELVRGLFGVLGVRSGTRQRRSSW